MASKIFIRRRDGRIEVKLNEHGRTFIKDVFAQVLSAEQNNDHVWHSSLVSPISPSDEVDNPMAMLQRQMETSTNAELASASADDNFIDDAEAWSWLSSLQVALRSVSYANGLFDTEALEKASEEIHHYIEALQTLLFALAEVL
jgi:hypothetical protein